MRLRWVRDQRGSQIVEFALIAPILISLVLMVPILGMAVRAWVVTEGAAREGARVLGVTGDASAACDRAFQEVTVFGQLPATSGGKTLFSRQDISLNLSTGEVVVFYRQPTVLPALGQLLNGNRLSDYFEVVGRARFRLERAPRGAGGVQRC
ncbi:MAG TPA: TadE/TadG family type IV pilus assembly protein [Symbiobacteriaceae bacterium]|nr:TadE/TadG family type IV pilus assembly protein [Symbiobacteriaceae bacterium]